MARRAIGEEPLPEEDPNNPIFKPLVEPSRLDSYLITNQISNYCGQINGYAFLHALSFCSCDNYGNSLFLCHFSALLVRALLRSTQWMRFIRNRLSSEVLILLKILDICFGKVPVFVSEEFVDFNVYSDGKLITRSDALGNLLAPKQRFDQLFQSLEHVKCWRYFYSLCS